MQEMIKELNKAFMVLSTIPVVGDNVDAMAEAKNILRQVVRELKEMETGGGPGPVPAEHKEQEGPDPGCEDDPDPDERG